MWQPQLCQVKSDAQREVRQNFDLFYLINIIDRVFFNKHYMFDNIGI